MPSLSNAVRTSSFNLHVTFALIIHLENAASTPLSPATPKPTCHFFPCTFPSHRFHLTWVGPVHKLWGSPSSVALGAFVVSCQLNLPLRALAVFSALHNAPALPQVLLWGTGLLCRWLSTRSAPSGAGRFLRPPWAAFVSFLFDDNCFRL